MFEMQPLPFARRMPAAEYHADPCPTPSLSHSVGVVMVRDAPIHAWLKHPRLGNVAKEPTPEMARGTLIHSLVLGTPVEVTPIDFENYRTKAAQDARDACPAGKPAILRREYIEAELVAVAIQIELDRLGVRLDGDKEACCFWEEETSLGPVLCRGMMDDLNVATVTINDLKTCRSASPRACAKHVIEYGYDVQHAAYTSFLRKYRPDLAGRESMRFLFAEELPAGSPKRAIVTVCELDGSMRELGQRRWQQACETWARCLRGNEWPGYSDTPVSLEAPAWALAEAVRKRSP